MCYSNHLLASVMVHQVSQIAYRMASEGDFGTLFCEDIDPPREARAWCIMQEDCLRVSELSCDQGLALLGQSIASDRDNGEWIAFKPFRGEHLPFETMSGHNLT